MALLEVRNLRLPFRPAARPAAAAVLLGAILAGCATTNLVDEALQAPGYPGGTAALARQIRDPGFHNTLVVAHRGSGTWTRDENSRRAARRVVIAGVPFMETDVRLSKDGQLYVMHDATVDRKTTGKGRLEDLSAAELDGLRLDNGETVPRVEDLYEVTRGKAVLLLDFKDEAAIAKTAEWIAASGSFDDFLFLVNQWGEMREAAAARERHPGLMILAEVENPADLDAVQRLFGGRLPDVVGTETSAEEVVERIHRGGAKVAEDILGWEYVPLYGSILTRHLVNRGVDLIQTDMAPHLWTWIRKRNAERPGRPPDPPPAEGAPPPPPAPGE